MGKWGWAWLGLAVLAGCSGPTDGGGADDEVVETARGFYADSVPPTKAQWAELEALGARGARVDQASFHPVTHGLSFLSGAGLGPHRLEPARAAKAFVANHPALFDGAAIEAVRAEPTGDGVTVRAHQRVWGRRVLGADLAFRFDGDGDLVAVSGRVVPPAFLPAARIRVADAEVIGRRLFAGLHPDLPAPKSAQEAEAVAFEAADGLRPAWRIALDGEGAAQPSVLALAIDDQTGEVLATEELLESLQGEGRGVFGERVPLQIELARRGYALVDATRGGGIQTFFWDGSSLPGTLETSPRLDVWDAVGSARGAAVDAHANAAAVFDYYRDVFGRRGIDGRSGGIVSTVHYGRMNNAFWDGEQMVYGDGDGRTFAPLSAGLDVVAHELTHGVSQASAGLGVRGQAGALNEAVSDAFASFVVRRKGDARQAWQIGAVVYTPGRAGDALRDLADPVRLGQPDHMRLYDDAPQDAAHDNGAVHFNSTIPGHAFYLMAEGGTDRTSGLSTSGIGADHAEQVLYHALTALLPASADFAQMARAAVASAHGLYGASEADAVQKAWEAVGVLVPARSHRPPPASGQGRESEPNDTRRKADLVPLGRAMQGEIASASDRDYFRFDLSSPADLDVALTGLRDDFDLALLDASGRVVARSQAPGAADERIRGRADAGTYYLKVHAPRGARVAHAPYVLQVQ